MKVLVTGGAGSIGSQIWSRSLLSEGHEVSILDDFQRLLLIPMIKHDNIAGVGDRSPSTIPTSRKCPRGARNFHREKIDARSFISAARAGRWGGHLIGQPQLYYETNVNGTLTLRWKRLRAVGI